ncbi:MAG: Holliday junction resolvase RuvX [Pseudomonadales bacterium]|nr:Holliday junction resolvase RuvX [Pseudomonadales bacterium]
MNSNLVMAFDFGMKKIGVAVGQKITATATPLMIIPARDGIPNWQTLEKLIQEWSPHHFVVGLPLNMDDTESEMSLLAEKFGRKLSGRYNIPHTTVDERLSSFEAREIAAANTPIDAIAAKLILETYFRLHGNSN